MVQKGRILDFYNQFTVLESVSNASSCGSSVLHAQVVHLQDVKDTAQISILNKSCKIKSQNLPNSYVVSSK